MTRSPGWPPDAPEAPQTIPGLIRARAGERPEAPALLDAGRTVTYGELGARVAALAGVLRRAGIGPDGRIALFAGVDAGIDAAILSIAAASVAPTAILSADAPPAWRESALDRIRPGLVLLREGAPASGIAAPVLRYRRGPEVLALTAGEPAGAPVVEPPPHAVAFILASSGTTGEPRLIPITHQAIIDAAIADSALIPDADGFAPGDRFLIVGSAAHAVFTWIYTAFWPGASAVIPGVDSAMGIAQVCSQRRPTIVGGTPALLASLADARRGGDPDPGPAVRLALTTGASMTGEMGDRIAAGLGCRIVDCYAASESLTIALDGVYEPGMVRIAAETGEILPAGAPGEIQACGPRTFGGYLDDPEATAAAFTVDGWYRTGDLGRIDERGRLAVLGRLSEVINRGGVKISPESIERAAREHPAVREAAAYPVPHPELGQEAGLAVVLAPGAALGRRDLRRWLLERLPANQMPHELRFVDRLPRTASGKIARLRLADQRQPRPGEQDAGA